MKIFVNNKEHETSSTNILDLVNELGFLNTKIAVALNNKMVVKENWQNTSLIEGSQIIIIKAVCGG